MSVGCSAGPIVPCWGQWMAALAAYCAAVSLAHANQLRLLRLQRDCKAFLVTSLAVSSVTASTRPLLYRYVWCTETASLEAQHRCSSTCRVATTSSRCCTNTSARSLQASSIRRALRHLRRHSLRRCLHSQQHARPRRSVPTQTWTMSSKHSSVPQRQQQQQQDQTAVSFQCPSYPSPLSHWPLWLSTCNTDRCF